MKKINQLQNGNEGNLHKILLLKLNQLHLYKKFLLLQSEYFNKEKLAKINS